MLNRHPLIPLHCCTEGQTARIEAIRGPTAQVHRLHELGLRRGRRLRVFRCGNPCILQIDGQKLCLRCGPDVRVLVRPEVSSGPLPDSPRG